MHFFQFIFPAVKMFEWMNDHFNRKLFEPLNGESHTTKQGAGDGYVSFSKIQMQTIVFSGSKQLSNSGSNAKETTRYTSAKIKGRDWTCLSICAPDDWLTHFNIHVKWLPSYILIFINSSSPDSKHNNIADREVRIIEFQTYESTYSRYILVINYCSLLCEKKRKQKDLHLRVTLNLLYYATFSQSVNTIPLSDPALPQIQYSRKRGLD